MGPVNGIIGSNPKWIIGSNPFDHKKFSIRISMFLCIFVIEN